MEGELLFLLIWCDHSVQSAQIIIAACLARDDLNACVIHISMKKATHAERYCLAGLATKKSRGTITDPPYVTAKWLPRPIPPLNFLAYRIFTPVATARSIYFIRTRSGSRIFKTPPTKCKLPVTNT